MQKKINKYITLDKPYAKGKNDIKLDQPYKKIV